MLRRRARRRPRSSGSPTGSPRTTAPTATSTTWSRSPRRAACLLQGCDDPANPNHAIAADNRDRLDAAGIEVVEVPVLPYADVGGRPRPGAVRELLRRERRRRRARRRVPPRRRRCSSSSARSTRAARSSRSPVRCSRTVAAACTASPSRSRRDDDPAHRVRRPRLARARRRADAGRRCASGSCRSAGTRRRRARRRARARACASPPARARGSSACRS